MKVAMEDVFGGLEYASHSLRAKHDMIDAVESARKSTIDHKEETAVTTSGKQSRERIHLFSLGFYIAQRSRFERKLSSLASGTGYGG